MGDVIKLLKQYSAREIGERRAVQKLGLHDTIELQLLMRKHRIPMPSLPEEEIDRQAAMFVDLMRDLPENDEE